MATKLANRTKTTAQLSLGEADRRVQYCLCLAVAIFNILFIILISRS